MSFLWRELFRRLSADRRGKLKACRATVCELLVPRFGLLKLPKCK
jgi:hypothetical protein